MIKQDFGDELRRQRKQRGLTLERLAHRADLAVSFVKAIEAGQKQATITTLYKLANALDASPSDLVMPAYQAWLKEQS